MSYQAIHYVKVDGCVYAPGETIDANIPSEKLDRLLHLGALATTSAPSFVPAESAEDETSEEGNVPDASDEDDEPAPEIDIADGILERREPTEGAEAKKPKRCGK